MPSDRKTGSHPNRRMAAGFSYGSLLIKGWTKALITYKINILSIYENEEEH